MKKIKWMYIISILYFLVACGGGGGGSGSNSSGTQPATYSVTYNGNSSDSGTVPVETTLFTEGQTVTVLGNTGGLAKSKYSFTGWNTVANGSGSTYTQGSTFIIGKANVILYAQWTAKPTYTITYNGNGNTGGDVPVDSTNYLNGQKVTVLGNISGLVKQGYTFTGWNTAADGSGIMYTQSQTFSMGSANTVLYAKWSKNPTYIVSYDDNDSIFSPVTAGSVPDDLTQYEENQQVTVLGNIGNLERNGYAFSKWNTEADGSGTDYFSGDTFIMGSANVTLYAQWVPTYIITYDVNGSTGGDAPADSNRYKQGETVTVLGNTGSLEKTGYTFAGWCIVQDGSGTTYTQGQQFIIGSADVTLYAKWTLIPTYNVTYDGNGSDGGSVPVDTTNYQQGATVTVPGNTGDLTKYGYSFTGWNTLADGSGNAYSQGETFCMSPANITLYAQWVAKPTYTVTYNGNGSDNVSVPVDSTSYLEGATVTVLGNINGLIKAGYTFTGWNSAANGSGTGYTAGNTFVMGASNVVLYAQWSLNPTYTVTYNGNGNTGGSVPLDLTSYEQSQTVTVAGNTGNLTKDHYLFAGWNTQADGNGTSYQQDNTFNMGTANVNLYAQWAPAYNVCYNGNGNTGGSVPVDSNNYTAGQIATILSNSGSLEKTGYSFTGWNTAADGSGIEYAAGNTIIMAASNVTLYAQWTALPVYYVTYDGNGNTGGNVPVDSTGYLDSQTFNVLGNSGNLTKTGYTFTGWNTESDGSGISYIQGQSGDIDAADIILYAQWSANPTYNVTYNDNGSNNGYVPVDNTNYLSGDIVTVSDNTGNLAKSGYAFAGWNTEANGSGTSYLAGSTFEMENSNITLYAQWVTAYTVTYNGNGNTAGSVPVDAVIYISGDIAIVLENTSLEKAGYMFNGWTLSSDGSGTVYSQGAEIVIGFENIILYAKWTALPTYNVSYNGNGNTGGTVPVDTTNYLSGQTATALANSGLLVKTSYTFAGWNTAADGSGTTYAPGATFVVTNNVTLYAKWVVSRLWYSITSSSDGTKLAAVVSNGQIYTSTDTGATWTARASARAWYAIAGSSDGMKLAAAVNGGQIYTSTDSGATWTARGSSRAWRGIASSSDGTKLAAVVNNGLIYTSADSGGTWTARGSSRFWRGIASSSDGTKLAAVVNNGQIYTSTDSGATWTARGSSRAWRGIASSSDGTKLAAVVSNGQIYTSIDSGATWTARASAKTWSAIASSSDGTKLAAAVNGGQIWTSVDSGATWTARASSQAWYSIASSSDGTNLAAVVNNGAIYTSGDSGETWMAR